MTELVNTVLNTMSSLSKPQKKFMAGLFVVLMCFQGKATFRNMSRYSDMSEKCFSRWFKKAFSYRDFNQQLLKCVNLDASESIAAIDASFMAKSGKKTNGLGYFYNGAKGTAERGLEMSLICCVNLKANTAYALDGRQTIEHAGQSRIDLYGQHLIDLAPALKTLGIDYLAADAYYSKIKFVDVVNSLGLHIVGKLRIDAHLKWLHTGEYSGQGRPKKYGDKVVINEHLSRFNDEGTLTDNTRVYSENVYSVSLKKEVRVVVLMSECGKGRAILFSTDTKLDPLTLVSYYKARFQIEFLFRDAKQYTGLTHCQATHENAIYHQVNASLAALNLLKIEDFQHKNTTDKTVISIASWKRRKANQHLLSRVFQQLGLSETCNKVSRLYKTLSEIGVIAA